MKSVMRVGSYIRYRDVHQEDGYMYAEVVKGNKPSEKFIRPMSCQYVPNGVAVQTGVWKQGGEVFEPRGKTFVMTKGGQPLPKLSDVFKPVAPFNEEDFKKQMGKEFNNLMKFFK